MCDTTIQLAELAAMSNKYGADPAYVLAGGGNTSYKTEDTLYVKGSGTSLATITEEGFVKMDRAKLAAIWNNTYSAIERAVNGGKSLAGTSDFVVEDNRWYDIRIEVTQNAMRCYVDGEMIISSVVPERQKVYVTSSVDAQTGDVILKIVNIDTRK